MTSQQIALIPSRMLYERGTRDLREWLHARGWTLTLFELHIERLRRGEGR